MTAKRSEPSDFELQILGVFWEHGPLTVRQVMSYLTDKKRAYTSVLSVIQVMQKKGLVAARAKREGLANVYEATVARSTIVKPLLKGLVSRVFGGRTSDVVQHLLQEGEVNQEEIAELRALLDESEKRLR
jgi:BlaI family penicillinase repressor